MILINQYSFVYYLILCLIYIKENLSSGKPIKFIGTGEKLNELLEPLNLGWRDRTLKETALMVDLSPLLKRLLPGVFIELYYSHLFSTVLSEYSPF